MNLSVNVSEDHPSLLRAGRFVTVGMLGTIIDVGLFTILRVLFGVPTLAANTISYSAGIVNNFILHRQWTYKGSARKDIAVQFVQFAAVSLTCLAINNALVLLLEPTFVALFSSPACGNILAKLCATGVGMCLSFLANTYWTFGQRTK